MAGQPRRRARLQAIPPRCGFTLRDGSRCGNASESNQGGPCAAHRVQADGTETSEGVTLAEATPVLQGDGSSPRARLRQDVHAGYEQLRAAVFDALEADKPLAVTCPSCNGRFEARVPDHTARLRAVDTALREGYGRPTDEDRSAQLTERDVLEFIERQAIPDLPEPLLNFLVARNLTEQAFPRDERGDFLVRENEVRDVRASLEAALARLDESVAA